MSDVKAIPKMLNLAGRKPTLVEAYSRQVASIATNAQSFGPNTYANIVIDTSTPGAFLDPHQTFLEFDFTVTNTNPYLDYFSLGAAGLGSLIEEFRFYNQGTPIEEILQYNVQAEHWMRLGGYNQTEFKMYMQNSWRPPVTVNDPNELNFVKPPMVDREGMIMWPNFVNMFGDRNTFCQHREQGPIITLSACTVQPQAMVQNAQHVVEFSKYPNLTRNQGGVATAVDGIRNPRIGNYVHTAMRYDGYSCQSAAPGTIGSLTFDNRLDNTYVTWPSTIRPEPLMNNLIRQQQEENLKNYRLQDYLMFLSNVKNIPIGVGPAKSYIKNENALLPTIGFGGSVDTNMNNQAAAANWNFTQVAADAAARAVNTGIQKGVFSMHAVLPLFSGLLGCWAEKAFPAMLISPGSFYLQIKWAKFVQAAQFSLDPCRRIFGTYRDYLPYKGDINYISDFRGQVITRTSAADPSPAPMSNENSVSPYMVITRNGATGCDYGYQGLTFRPYGTGQAAGESQGYLYNRTNQLINAQRDAAGLVPAVDPLGVNYTGVALNGNNQYLIAALGDSEGSCTGNAKPQYYPRLTPWKSTFNGWEQGTGVGTQANPDQIETNCPVTWERNACYGTYLPASTAQVRRISSETNGSITGDPFSQIAGQNLEPGVTYLITNLQLTSIQVIVPDEVTAAIVRQAAEADISLDAQSVHTYRTVCSASQSQSIILPIKLASANSLYILFMNQLSQESPYYNSLRGICPFTSFEYTRSATGYFVGSEIKPKYTGTNTTNNPFSVQLKIGNELFPQYPITNIPGIIKELQRSVHGTGDMNCHLPYFTSARSNRFADVRNATPLPSEYTSIATNQFTAPFVHYLALDDQTITNNAVYNFMYRLFPPAGANTGPPGFMTTRADVVGGANDNYPNYNDRGTYMWPAFMPPESSFVLGFDLDTFPGQSDQARSGRFLGNAPLTLQMTNCVGLNNKSLTDAAGVDAVYAFAFCLHDIRFSIMAGGQMLSYF